MPELKEFSINEVSPLKQRHLVTLVSLVRFQSTVQEAWVRFPAGPTLQGLKVIEEKVLPLL